MKKKVLGLLAICCICAVSGCAGGNTAGNKENQKTEATEKATEVKTTEAPEKVTEVKTTEAPEKATEAKTTEAQEKTTKTTEAKATEAAETEGKAPEPAEEETIEPETAAPEAAAPVTEVPETGAEGDTAPTSNKTWETYTSEMGYSLQYDSSAFTVEHTEDLDVFTYQMAENAEAPIYLSVQKYPDMDALSAANGLALQAGNDETMVLDTNIGAAGQSAKYVYAQEEVNGVTQMQVFYVLSQGEGSLVVEICSYIGAPEGVDGNFENMMGTFSCTEG